MAVKHEETIEPGDYIYPLDDPLIGSSLMDHFSPYKED